MLITAESLRQLRFGALMEVYLEGNLENAAELWPEQPRERQLHLAEQDFYDYLQQTFFAQSGACYCIWEENGRYVSALRLEPYRDGLLLEALETAPNHRRKGYAQMLIRAVQAMLQKQGVCKVYSHVGKKNAPSLAVHQRCGFQRISETAVYMDGSANDHCCTLLWQHFVDKER